MNEKEFTALCKRIVTEYVNKRLGGNITEDNVYIVWMCKTLQNSKALVSTNQRDGMYYELTFNGDKREVYLDAYKKRENIALSPDAEIMAADANIFCGELIDTAPMMASEDHEERFRAEYYQLMIRINKLTTMLSAWEGGTLTFTPACDYDLMKAQLDAMNSYMFLLKMRACRENIEL